METPGPAKPAAAPPLPERFPFHGGSGENSAAAAATDGDLLKRATATHLPFLYRTAMTQEDFRRRRVDPSGLGLLLAAGNGLWLLEFLRPWDQALGRKAAAAVGRAFAGHVCRGRGGGRGGSGGRMAAMPGGGSFTKGAPALDLIVLGEAGVEVDPDEGLLQLRVGSE